MKLLKLFAALIAILCVASAADTWNRVRQLKSGTEIRVFKKGSTKPVVGTFDEADDIRLVMLTKNEQFAIHKDEINRLDYRPKAGAKMTSETKEVEKVPGSGPSGALHPHNNGGPERTYTSGVSFGGKQDFETIYRRVGSE